MAASYAAGAGAAARCWRRSGRLPRNRTVTPQTKVRLFGKVDKEMMEPTKVDVKYLEIVK